MSKGKGVQFREEKHFPDVKAGPDGISVDDRTPLVRYNDRGEQILEDTPVEVPLGWNAPESIEVTIARMVRTQLSMAAEAAGFETMDEAYDFDMSEGDDFEEHLTPAELHAMMHAPEMQEEWPSGKRNAGRVEGGEEAGSDSGRGDKGVRYGAGRSKAGEDAGDSSKSSSAKGKDVGSSDKQSDDRPGVGESAD